jgi:membrane protein
VEIDGHHPMKLAFLKTPEDFLPRFIRWVWYYVSGMHRRLGEHHAYLMAGGLAFSLFVCAVPLVLVIFAVLSNLFARPAVAGEIEQMIDRLVPYPEYAVSVKEFIAERLATMADVKRVAGIVGVVGLLVAASGLFSSLRTILKAVFKPEKREWVLIGKLWDLGLVVIVLSFFVLLIVALPTWEAAFQLAKNTGWLQNLPAAATRGLGLWLISLLTLFIAFAGIYWLVPVRKPSRRAILTGALWGALLWLLAKELFGYYIGHIATLKQVYGVYTFLIVAAFWIYYSALVLIVGAELGQLSAERHPRHAGKQKTSPH